MNPQNYLTPLPSNSQMLKQANVPTQVNQMDANSSIPQMYQHHSNPAPG